MRDDPPADTSPGRRVSRAVRASVAYLAEHAREQVRIADLEPVSGLSTRGLQLAFDRDLHVTPMEYLRMLRLEGVRRELEFADPSDGVTIASVAARWQFSNVGRLARIYRDAYGVSPSATLRLLGDDAVEVGPGSVLAAMDTEHRRFRLVLDCEIDVTDALALDRTARHIAAGNSPLGRSYVPDGGTADIVAYLVARGVRVAVGEADGIALLAINPLVRVPGADGDYAQEELPAWPATGSRPRSDTPTIDERREEERSA